MAEEWLHARLTRDFVFNSPYDQADGHDVKYDMGTSVQYQNHDERLVLIKAPNGRIALVERNLIEYNIVTEVKNTTVCSRMHCYNEAELTNDPSKPPFCEDHKPKK